MSSNGEARLPSDWESDDAALLLAASQGVNVIETAIRQRALAEIGALGTEDLLSMANFFEGRVELFRRTPDDLAERVELGG